MSSVSPQTQICSVFFDEKFAGMGVILFLTENISLWSDIDIDIDIDNVFLLSKKTVYFPIDLRKIGNLFNKLPVYIIYQNNLKKGGCT